MKSNSSQLLNLSLACSICTGCLLHKTRTRTVFGSGNPEANVVVIGEAPGAKEDSCGLPFQGRAGERLENELLPLAGLTRDEVYITNICKCRPITMDGRNRRPRATEKRACQRFLVRELEILRPRIIVLLGLTAVRQFFGYKASVSGYRGNLVIRDGWRLFPTYHPSPLANKYSKELKKDFRTLGKFLS